MPGWSWPIIWLVLVLALLGMLALSGWRLFHALAQVFAELQSLAAKLDDFSASPLRRDVLPADQLAVFGRYRDTLRSYLALRSRAAERKLQRRALRIDRARIITSLGTIKREWPNVR